MYLCLRYIVQTHSLGNFLKELNLLNIYMKFLFDLFSVFSFYFSFLFATESFGSGRALIALISSEFDCEIDRSVGISCIPPCPVPHPFYHPRAVGVQLFAVVRFGSFQFRALWYGLVLARTGYTSAGS